jgi:hypothetical protein
MGSYENYILSEFNKKATMIREAIQTRCNFVLSAGLCPYNSVVDYQNGFKKINWEENGQKGIVLCVSLSREKIFAVFVEIVKMAFKNDGNVSSNADVILESSHKTETVVYGPIEHMLYKLEEVDVVSFLSDIYSLEDLLVDDGCAGVYIFTPGEETLEVDLSEHKIIHLYTENRQLLYDVSCFLVQQGLEEIPDLQLIIDAPHVHGSSDRFEKKFIQFIEKTGAKHIGCRSV